MRFSELSPEDKDYLLTIYNEDITHREKMDILTKRFNVVGRTIRNWWATLGATKRHIAKSRQLQEAANRSLDENLDILLVTSAQNRTTFNRNMFKSLLNYKDFLEGKGFKVDIAIIPTRYRNPTARREFAKYDSYESWWAPELEEYLIYDKVMFGDVLISADSRVTPTAMNPLSGYEVLAGNKHLILGHPRVHFKTLPRFYGEPLYTMATTGYITNKNYSRSKAGDKGFEHHSYGFVVLEKDTRSKCFIPRNVKVNYDGTFTDLGVTVTVEGVSEAKAALAYVPGDIHHEVLDPAKWGATLSIIGKLSPYSIFLHDLLDASRINPHESKDLYIKRRKIVEGRYDIKEEIDNAVKFATNLQSTTGSDIFVVQSNHDDFLDKFINEFNWKRDLHNSPHYLEYARIQQTEDLSSYGNIFGYIVSKGNNIEYVPSWRGISVSGYQLGHHGDKGINGARGSVNSFRRVNTKMIHGHCHSPQLKDGVTAVGVSCDLWQYYNSKGMSSWAQADAVVHATGKSQLLVYNDNYKISNLI